MPSSLHHPGYTTLPPVLLVPTPALVHHREEARGAQGRRNPWVRASLSLSGPKGVKVGMVSARETFRLPGDKT